MDKEPCLTCGREDCNGEHCHDYGCPSCNAIQGLCRACEVSLQAQADYYDHLARSENWMIGG